MNIVNIEDYKGLTYKVGENIEIVFFTAEGDLTFNRRTSIGQNNLENIKNWFHIDKVAYLNQIHSDIIHIYNGNDHIINSEGDGLITDNKNTAVGVFTADCVPVILVDNCKGVVAAIHSGWRGTYENIVGKAIALMEEEYNCNIKDIKAFIGPHNRQCCYEVSEELIHKFKSLEMFKDEDISSGRMLSLENCIRIELKNKGVKDENITSTNQCTFCSKDFKLFSYRRENEKEGRMYSFVFIR